MVFYSSLIIIYFIAFVFEKHALKKIGRKQWTFILLFPLFFIVAFKDYSVGSDTLTYKIIFENSNSMNLAMYYKSYIELGYRLINLFFNQLGLNFFGFQIIYSIFIYFSISKLLVKYSKNIAFSIFVFISLRLQFFAMTGMRQMISVCILTYSVSYIVERKAIKFYILVAISTLVHNTSILFGLLYFLPLKNIKPKGVIKISIISVFIIAFSDKLIYAFVDIFPKYQSYLTRIESYDGSFVFIQLLLFAFFVILGFRRNNISYNNKITEHQTWINVAFYSYLLSLFSIKINIAGRLLKYFVILIAIYLSNLLESINKPMERVLLYYIVSVMLMIYYFVILIYRPNWDGILPYNFIF